MQEEKKGYVKIYRKIEDWKYFRDPYVLQVFIFCLLHCEYVKDDNSIAKFRSGTFETSITEMANILGKGRPKIYECLKILKDDGAIDYETKGKITTIRVLKYDLYQSDFIANFSKKIGNEL